MVLILPLSDFPGATLHFLEMHLREGPFKETLVVKYGSSFTSNQRSESNPGRLGGKRDHYL